MREGTSESLYRLIGEEKGRMGLKKKMTACATHSFPFDPHPMRRIPSSPFQTRSVREMDDLPPMPPIGHKVLGLVALFDLSSSLVAFFASQGRSEISHLGRCSFNSCYWDVALLGVLRAFVLLGAYPIKRSPSISVVATTTAVSTLFLIIKGCVAREHDWSFLTVWGSFAASWLELYVWIRLSLEERENWYLWDFKSQLQPLIRQPHTDMASYGTVDRIPGETDFHSVSSSLPQEHQRRDDDIETETGGPSPLMDAVVSVDASPSTPTRPFFSSTVPKEIAAIATQAMDQLLEDAKDDGWNFHSHDRGVRVFRKAIEGCALDAMKGIGHINFSIDDVSAVVYNLSNKGKWDPMFQEGWIVERFDENTDVLYQAFHSVWPTAPRDSVLVRYRWYMPDGRRAFCMKSISHPGCPERQGYVRAEVMGGGCVLARGEHGGTVGMYIARLDLKGKIPTFLVNFAATRQPLVMACVRDYMCVSFG